MIWTNLIKRRRLAYKMGGLWPGKRHCLLFRCPPPRRNSMLCVGYEELVRPCPDLALCRSGAGLSPDGRMRD